MTPVDELTLSQASKELDKYKPIIEQIYGCEKSVDLEIIDIKNSYGIFFEEEESKKYRLQINLVKVMKSLDKSALKDTINAMILPEEGKELARKYFHLFLLAHELYHQKQVEEDRISVDIKGNRIFNGKPYSWLTVCIMFERVTELPWEIEANQKAYECIKQILSSQDEVSNEYPKERQNHVNNIWSNFVSFFRPIYRNYL